MTGLADQRPGWTVGGSDGDAEPDGGAPTTRDELEAEAERLRGELSKTRAETSALEARSVTFESPQRRIAALGAAVGAVAGLMAGVAFEHPLAGVGLGSVGGAGVGFALGGR